MGKHFQYYQKEYRRILKWFMATIILMLLAGISVSPISWKHDPHDMMLQSLLITGIIISLLIYSKKETPAAKSAFICLITIYVYAKFWTFPQTAVMLALFAMVPLISIFLFDKLGFYVTLALNIVLGPSFIFFISHSHLKSTYSYVAMDSFGNILNFIAIQVILLFVFIGMNNRMKMADSYQKETQQMLQSESIGQLAATIAHEIRNPITVVKGFAQLIDQETKTESEKFYVKAMLNELEFTQIIINDYLSLAKPQTDNIQTVQVNQEVQKIADLLTSFANQRNIGILLNFHDKASININPTEFKQLLVNIIKNGIESMPDAGFITIETGIRQGLAEIKITDTGIGLTEEQLEKLGTPFYSLKDRGNGIGLTVCYSIVQKYKGKISIASRLNQGTTFSITFPLIEESD